LALKTSDIGLYFTSKTESFQGDFQTNIKSLKQLVVLLRNSKATLHTFHWIVLYLIFLNQLGGIIALFASIEWVNHLQLELIQFDIIFSIIFMFAFAYTEPVNKLNKFKPRGYILSFSFYFFNIL